MKKKLPVIGYIALNSAGTRQGDRITNPDALGWILVQEHNFLEAINEAGAVAVHLKFNSNKSALETLYEMTDGILIPGGSDVHPKYYGEKIKRGLKIPVEWDNDRDLLEEYILKKAMRDKKPILGICRGAQSINVRAGGSLYQDIVTELKNNKHTTDKYPHYPDSPKTHVRLKSESKLARILGADKYLVNCAHHQAIKKVAPGYEAVGYAKDGIVEAIEKKSDDHWVIGIQGHPEATLRKRPVFKRLFKEFVSQAAKYSRR